MVEQPRAISAVSAFSKDFFRHDVPGTDVVLQKLHDLASPPSLPGGSARRKPPGWSRFRKAQAQDLCKAFMELAVNIPEQEPQPGQELPSISASSPSPMRPAFLAPTASNTEFKSLCPMESMGPPDTKIQGRFRRRAAMSIPGTILSQLGMNTRASKQWPLTMHSMVSAISSLELKEKCMPLWPHGDAVADADGIKLHGSPAGRQNAVLDGPWQWSVSVRGPGRSH